MLGQKIFDKEGRSYDAAVSTGESLIIIKLYDRQFLIGEAKCVRESPDTLLLGDISIANDFIPKPANAFIAIFRSVIGFEPKSINYRNRGLGSALLKLLIAQARATGVRSVYGNVYRQDLENTSGLLKWYERHGFEVKQPASGKNGDVIAQVTFNFK